MTEDNERKGSVTGVTLIVTGSLLDLGGIIEDVAGDGDENCCHACLLSTGRERRKKSSSAWRLITVNLS